MGGGREGVSGLGANRRSFGCALCAPLRMTILVGGLSSRSFAALRMTMLKGGGQFSWGWAEMEGLEAKGVRSGRRV